MRISRLWRNWPVHNLVSHPLSEVVHWFTAPFCGPKVSGWIHDVTIPEGHDGPDVPPAKKTGLSTQEEVGSGLWLKTSQDGQLGLHRSGDLIVIPLDEAMVSWQGGRWDILFRDQMPSTYNVPGVVLVDGVLAVWAERADVSRG